MVTEEVKTLYLVKYETLAKQIKSSNSRNKKSGLVSILLGFGRNMIAALYLHPSFGWCAKCAGIIDLKARKNNVQVYNDLSNIYRKVFEVQKQFLYCVERFCIVLSDRYQHLCTGPYVKTEAIKNVKN